MNCSYCKQSYNLWTENHQPQPPNVIGRLPLLLQCGHSYCQMCIEGLSSVLTYVRCHICSVTTQFEEEKTSLLPFDFTTIGKLFVAGESFRPEATAVSQPSERAKSRAKKQSERKEEGSVASVPVSEDDPGVVRAVEVASPDEVILERLSSGDRLTEMVRKCSEQAAQSPSFSLREWMNLKPRKRFLSKGTKDVHWYRCEVVESRHKMPPVDSSNVQKVRVRYLDVGRRDWVSFSQVRQIPSNLADLEPLCANCSLNLVPPANSETWSHVETSALSQLLNPSRKFRVIDLNVSGSSKLCVDLRPVGIARSLSVRQWCVMSGLARFPDGEDSLDEEQKAAVAGVSDVNRAVTASMLLFPDANGDDAVQAYQRSTFVELPDQCLVKVACLDSLPSIWVTPHPLAEEMSFERTDPGLTGVEAMFCPRVGGLYAAEYSDGLWYRCVVETLEQKEARVLSVDFGNHWCVEWEKAIARLSKTYQDKPFLANRVRLASLQFPRNAHEERVEVLLQSSPVYLLRYHSTVVGHSREDKAVYLIHRTSCANLRLVETGLALATAESAQLMRDLTAQTIAQVQCEFSDKVSGTLGVPPPPLAFITPASARLLRHCRGRYKFDVAVGDAVSLTQAALRSTDRRLGLLSAADAQRLFQMPSCSIVATDRPDQVFVRMDTPGWQRHRQRLAAALSQLHTSHRDPSSRLQSAAAARVGSLCAVVRPLLLDWCRGVIVRVVDADDVEVLLIDLGEKLQVPVTYVVQPLDETLVRRWAQLATRCRLVGVAPVGGEAADWSSVSKDVMAQVVRAAGSRALLSGVTSDAAEMPGVDLILPDVDLRWKLSRREEEEEEGEEEKENERLIALRHKLVDCGVARPLLCLLPTSEFPSLKPRPVCEAALRSHLGLSAAPHSVLSCPVCSAVRPSDSASDSSTASSRCPSPPRKASRTAARWPQQRVVQFVGRSGVSVVVTRLDEDLTVACRLAGNAARVKRLEDAASRVCVAGGVEPRPSAGEWQVGEACFVGGAREEARWRRGQVVAVMREAESVRVYLIDHAQILVCGNQSLRPVDGSSASQRSLFVPPIAWRCRIAVDVRGGAIPKSRLEKAREVLTSGVESRIHVLEMEAGEDGISTLVCKLWCPKLSSDEVGQHLSVVDVPKRAYLPCSPVPEGVVVRVEVTAALEGDLVFLQHVVTHEEAEELAVKFPHLKAWFSVARRQWEMINDSEVHFELQQSGRREEVIMSAGAICSAVFSSDQLWYRAQLMKQSGAGRWEVFFVDFGNGEVVDVTQLTHAVKLEVPACCCLYRWAGVERLPHVSSGPQFCAELIGGLAQAGALYMRRQAARSNQQQPVMELFTDKECTVSAVDLVPSLLIRTRAD